MFVRGFDLSRLFALRSSEYRQKLVEENWCAFASSLDFSVGFAWLASALRAIYSYKAKDASESRKNEESRVSYCTKALFKGRVDKQKSKRYENGRWHAVDWVVKFAIQACIRSLELCVLSRPTCLDLHRLLP